MSGFNEDLHALLVMGRARLLQGRARLSTKKNCYPHVLKNLRKKIKKLTLNTYFPREFGARFKEKQENIVSGYKIYLYSTKHYIYMHATS